MRLEGTLDAFSLPDIFQLLSFTKKTGALHLRRGDTHGIVHFTTGSVTGATADEARQALGRRVVGTGTVADGALASAVERVAGDAGVGLARALREAGAVDEGLLHELIAEQAVDAVFDLLRWPDGEFGFVLDEVNPDDLGVMLPVDEVVAEARRRLDYWQTVSRTIPSPDSVLCTVAALPGELSIGPAEWSLLTLIDGRRSVAELIGLTGRGEFTTVSALAALVDRGLVVVRRGDESDAASALLRRHLILGQLESATAPATSSSGAPPASYASAGDATPPVSHVDPAAAAARSLVPQAAMPPVSHTPNGVPAGAGTMAAGPSHGSAPDAANVASQIAASLSSPSTSAAAATGGLTAARPEDRNVTPARPEPFLPRRRPDHPEDQMVPSSVSTSTVGPVVGSTAVAAQPATGAMASPHIERDPSVNKSLLLRLIAGVRGL